MLVLFSKITGLKDGYVNSLLYDSLTQSIIKNSEHLGTFNAFKRYGLSGELLHGTQT